MAKRKGLLLDHTGAVGAALKSVGLCDWDFHIVGDIEAAKVALKADKPCVAFVAFDPTYAWPAGDIEALVSSPDVEWVAVLGKDLLRNQDQAPMILRNFHDFHTLPLDPRRLQATLTHAFQKAAGTISPDERSFSAKPLSVRFGLTGCCPKMLELYRQIDKIVTVDAPVLISGEAGSGKELVARAIHGDSERADQPFVMLNCATTVPDLMQSELFGCGPNAFAGPDGRKNGKLEASSGGVLFLEEIHALPLDLQAELLRFLQDKTVAREGSTSRFRIDVRIIAATRVDLGRAVQAGRFREDLFNRLSVLHLKVPPLRERGGDIALLADHVFQQQQKRRSTSPMGFSSEALHAMREYTWPGNVRELVNLVRDAMTRSENRLVSAADLRLPTPRAARGERRSASRPTANARREGDRRQQHA